MANEKERFEILLEDMYDKIKIVAEGHGILVNKIEEVDKKAEARAKGLENMIMSGNKILHEKIDNVKAEVAEVRTEVKQEINEVKKGINKIDAKLTNVIERQDMQEKKLEKVYQKVFRQ